MAKKDKRIDHRFPVMGQGAYGVAEPFAYVPFKEQKRGKKDVKTNR